MERKLLLVFALTFLLIILGQPLLKKYGPQQPPAATQQKPAETAVPPTSPEAQVPPPTTQAKASAVPTAKIKGESEQETVVENDLYKITFSNRGAQVKSWILKKYTDDAGKPLELVNAAAAPKYGYPLSLWTYDEGLRSKLNSVLYVGSNKGNLTAPA